MYVSNLFSCEDSPIPMWQRENTSILPRIKDISTSNNFVPLRTNKQEKEVEENSKICFHSVLLCLVTINEL